LASSPRLLILEDPLDHVNLKEKREIISKLVSKENTWNIVISSVDDVWKEFIDNVIQIENGNIIPYTKK